MALFGFGKKKEKPAPAPASKPAPIPKTLDELFEDAYGDYVFQKGYFKKFDAVFQTFLQLAEQGHGKALLQCAEMYSRGEGVEKDLRRALELAEKAKTQGVPGAELMRIDIATQFTLEYGGSKKTTVKITPPTPAPKVEAPKPSPAPAQPAPVTQPGDDLTLEEQYTKGMELFKAGDYDGAFPLLEQACLFFGPRKAKYSDGQAALGWMYENGQGTEAGDNMAYFEAYIHYENAAQNGNKDGMAGMVRLTAKEEAPSVSECQTALDYIKQLGTEEAKSLLSTVERKLVEAQKREELKKLDLTEKNVQDIFNKCLAKQDSKEIIYATLFPGMYGYNDEDEEPIQFDKEALFSNEQNIIYLFGQLQQVHLQHQKSRVNADDYNTNYHGEHWTRDKGALLKFCYLGQGINCITPFRASTSTSMISRAIKPTLSPKAPDFPAWWEAHKAEWEQLARI